MIRNVKLENKRPKLEGPETIPNLSSIKVVSDSQVDIYPSSVAGASKYFTGRVPMDNLNQLIMLPKVQRGLMSSTRNSLSNVTKSATMFAVEVIEDEDYPDDTDLTRIYAEFVTSIATIMIEFDKSILNLRTLQQFLVSGDDADRVNKSILSVNDGDY